MDGVGSGVVDEGGVIAGVDDKGSGYLCETEDEDGVDC